jgi:hypothetical protein
MVFSFEAFVASAAQPRVEEVDRAAPGEFRRGLVVAGGRVVVEAVLNAGIDEGFVGDLRVLQRRLIGRPASVDAIVDARVMDQQRRLDVLGLFRLRLAAVEGHGRREFGELRREEIRDAAAVAEADDADLAVALGQGAQRREGGDEILARLFLIELLEEFAGLVLVAGIAAERREAVGREGDEIGQRETARNVGDMRVEAAIFMHDENDGELAGRLRRLHQIALHRPIALGRGIFDRLADDARVIFRDLLGFGEARLQRVERRGRAQTELAGAVEKAATIDVAMDVEIEGFENPGIEVPGGQT